MLKWAAGLRWQIVTDRGVPALLVFSFPVKRSRLRTVLCHSGPPRFETPAGASRVRVPSLVPLLSRLGTPDPAARLDAKARSALRCHGILVRDPGPLPSQSVAFTAPPARLASAPPSARRVIMCGTAPPPARFGALPIRKRPRDVVLLLADAWTGLRHPVTMPPALASATLATRSARGALSARDRHRLESCEIAGSPLRPAPAQWTRAQADLGQHSVCVVRGLVTALLLASFRAHLRRRIRDGFLRRPDPGGPERISEHNEPFSRELNLQLAPWVSRMAGRSVKASYSFTVEYSGRAELPPHLDRRQCEYTLSIDLGPSRGLSHDWPLRFHSEGLPARLREVVTRPGDAVLFKGRDLHHSRGRMNRGSKRLVCLLHFVDQAFRGSLS